MGPRWNERGYQKDSRRKLTGETGFSASPRLAEPLCH
jgi:hypothetical protein